MNDKIFTLSNKEDYIYYLAELIIDFITYKNRLSTYQLEMNKLIEENKNNHIVDTYLYQSVSDRIKSLFYYIFNLIGDETKTAVSYRKFRKRLYKNRMFLKLNIDDLSQEERQIINYFNKHRNWGLHIPESLFVHKKDFFNIDSKYINEHKKTIIVPHYNFFEIEYLEKLNKETNEVLSLLEKLEKRIFKDYQILVDENFEILIVTEKLKSYKIMDIVKSSFNTNSFNNKNHNENRK